MAETTAKERSERTRADPELEEVTAEPSAGSAHAPVACPVAWCPICLAVTAVQPLKPDVVEHLLKAGAELLMAMRAVVDARTDEVAGKGEDGASGAVRLEKIDIG